MKSLVQRLSVLSSVAFAALSVSSLAQAAETPKLTTTSTVEYNGMYVPVQINQFNPTRGLLTGVRITVFQRPNSLVRVENLGVGAPTYTASIRTIARAQLRISDGLLTSTTLTSQLEGTRNRRFTPYDGVLDYGGTSGVSYQQSGTIGETYTIRNAQLLTKFTGVPVAITNPLLPDLLSGTTTVDLQGLISLGLVTDPANTRFSTLASAAGDVSVTIVYEYLGL